MNEIMQPSALTAPRSVLSVSTEAPDVNVFYHLCHYAWVEVDDLQFSPSWQSVFSIPLPSANPSLTPSSEPWLFLFFYSWWVRYCSWRYYRKIWRWLCLGFVLYQSWLSSLRCDDCNHSYCSRPARVHLRSRWWPRYIFCVGMAASFVSEVFMIPLSAWRFTFSFSTLM